MQNRVTDIPLPANLEVLNDRWNRAPRPVRTTSWSVILVIEGELIEDTPSGRNIMRAGQAFWRPAHGSHNVKNTGSTNARVLAIHFDRTQ